MTTPTAEIFELSKGLTHFSNKCSSTVYMKSALNLVEQFFLKMMLGGQKFQEGSTMDDAITLLVIFFSIFKKYVEKCSKLGINI